MKPLVAGLLSFFLNGLGQIYNGQIKKGVIFIIVSFIFTVMLVWAMVLLFKGFILSMDNNLDFKLIMRGAVLFTIAVFFLCLNGILSIIDAYKMAKR